MLEETGLILQVGAWALRRAVLDHGRWLQQGLSAPRIAVNVSQIQMRQRDFVDVVREAIAHGAAPTGIDLEITESLLMEDIEGSIRKLKEVRDLGLKIAIDDFGTAIPRSAPGAAPVHTLKIDRSFIMKMMNDPNAMTLCRPSSRSRIRSGCRWWPKAWSRRTGQNAAPAALRRDAGLPVQQTVPFDQMSVLLRKD